MLNPRLDQLTDYPFQRLRELLGDITPPDGVEPVMMSIGEPRHNPPAFVAKVLAEKAELWGRYPPPEGTPEFRQAVAGWLTRRYGLPEGLIEADKHLLPVAGSREALYMVGQVAVTPGHDPRPAVLFPNPFYQVYAGAAIMAGAEPMAVTAGKETEFQPDYGALPPELLDRTALAYVCSPANPQGSVASRDYLKGLHALARKHDFILACDECYSEIYSDRPPPGILEVCGGDLTNIVVFNSLSKRSSAPGLRSGFVAGDETIIKAFARLRSYGGASVPGPVLAASAALWNDEAHVKESLGLYRSKMEVAEEILGDRFGFSKPEGSFFLWLDVGDGEAAARRLWRDGAIRVLPGAYLARPDEKGNNPGQAYIRAALVHGPEATADALTRIKAILGP